MDQFVNILTMIGTIAFAISGAIIAAESKLDLFGIITLGVVTACGGGILRDIVLGIFPPQAFIQPIYVGVSGLVSLIVFLFMNFGFEVGNQKHRTYLKQILLWMDTLGLAIFTVSGVHTAWLTDTYHHAFLCVFSGVLTGVGGGLLRDIMSMRLPYILHKDIYAIASIVGGIAAVIFYGLHLPIAAILVGIGVTSFVRLYAVWRKWNLPNVKRDSHSG